MGGRLSYGREGGCPRGGREAVLRVGVRLS